MAAKYLVGLAIIMIIVQEGLSNPPVPVPGKAWEGRAQSGYVRRLDKDRKAVEVGRVDAVGVEKTGFRQRHIHTNSPYYTRFGYYGGYYPYHSGLGYGHGYGYPFYGQGYGHGYGHGYPFGGYYGHGHSLGHGLGHHGFGWKF